MSSSPAHVSLLPPPDGSVGDTAYSDTPKKEVKVEMRVLTPSEVIELQPVFEKAGAVTPDPSVSFVVGILEDGKVTDSFLVVQTTLHAEPLHLLPKHRPYLRAMAHFAENEIVSRCGIQNVFLFAPPGDVESLAQAFGFKTEPWAVLSKTVGPTGEPS